MHIRGIGDGVARRFVEEGARVAIADLKRAAAEETAAKLSAMGPGAAMGVEMNDTDERAVNDGVDQVATKWGGFDVAETALLFASFPTNALTGQSLVVSHGWFME